MNHVLVRTARTENGPQVSFPLRSLRLLSRSFDLRVLGILLVFNADFCADFSQSLFSRRALTGRRYSPSVTGRRATSPRKVAAIPLVTTRGRSARSATLTEHGATRIPQLLRRLRRRGKCAWGSRGQGDGNRRPVVLCRPWGPRPPRPRSPQRPPRLLPASAAFQAGSRCVEVWFCLRMWGSALERHFQARGDGRAASRGGSGRRSP